MSSCSKKTKCCTPKPKCKAEPFLFTKKFYILCAVINVFLIIIRVTYLEKFKMNKELLYFIAWLELQILSFYVLLLSAYKVYNILKYYYDDLLIELAGLYNTRITNYIMKWLTLIQIDLFFWRLWCITWLIFDATMIFITWSLYVSLVMFFASIILGYTHF